MKCSAFAPTEFPELWMPCANETALFGKYCAMHRDAIDGVILGLQNQGNYKTLADLMDEFHRSILKLRAQPEAQS